MTQRQTNALTSVLLTGILFGSLALTGCNQSMKLTDPVAAAQDSQGVDQPANPNAPNPWDAVKTALNGKVDGSSMNGKVILQVDSVNQALIFYIPLPLDLINFPVQSIEIPDLPGVSLFQLPQPDGSTQLGVRVPLKYLLKGAQLGAYNTLPNGDPLPYMPVGDNRGFAISLPQNPNFNLHFYVSANSAAVFVEVPQIVLPDVWSILKIGFPIKNADKTQVVGYFSFVPNRSTFASGVYVAGRIPTQVAVALDSLLKF